jgi:hypothetical protein
MKKLLLHTCCAPCLSGANIVLIKEDLDVTGYFYNPNIQPQDELARRAEALKKYSTASDFNAIIIESYDIRSFEREVAGKPGGRCGSCYRLRLEAAARYAKQNRYDCFSTTLLLSPYQKHDLVKSVGEETSKKHGIGFYYRDLRPFYAESVRISKETGLYRQKYCGCLQSKEKKNEQVSLAS